MSTNLYKRLKTDSTAEEQGVPVEFGSGLVINIRSTRSKVVRAIEQKISKRNRKFHMNGEGVPAEVQDADNIDRCVAIVTGFVSGVTDEEGRELPFSEANVRKIASDLAELREMIIGAAMLHETFRAEELKASTANLSIASVPGSGMPVAAAQIE